MRSTVRVGLIGDRNPEVTAHRAIPEALRLAGEAAQVAVEATWLGTETIPEEVEVALSGFDALWGVPSTPYRSTEGALRAIRFAREQGVPFLGTCGGFQHAVLEYARDVMGWADAAHAEIDPEAKRAVISPLGCALVEVRDTVRLVPGSRIARAYGATDAEEGYHCRYGINPQFESALVGQGVRVTARDEQGEIRAIELPEHPFFVAALFQPERAALQGKTPPIVLALVQAASARAQKRAS